MTASIEVENPTPEKIERAKQLYYSQGYTFVGEANTSMHLESKNSFNNVPVIITLYFEKYENFH